MKHRDSRMGTTPGFLLLVANSQESELALETRVTNITLGGATTVLLMAGHRGGSDHILVIILSLE